MGKEDILYTKKYFDFYCKKNKSFFDKINRLEEQYDVLSASYISLDRYKVVHDFLISNGLLSPDLVVLDF